MSAVTLFKDMAAFPTAWFFTGMDYKEAKEKGRAFLYSTARVAIAGGIVWGLFKWQGCGALRKYVPLPVFTARVGKHTLSLEPLSLLINLYVIRTSLSNLQSIAQVKWDSKIELGKQTGYNLYQGFSGVSGVWKWAGQMIREWPKEAPSAFSARILKAAIDPLPSFTRMAGLAIPETRLGIGLFLTILGFMQLKGYTIERWNLRDIPTELALKGVAHVVIGAMWIDFYEHYHRGLNTHAKEKTYLYRAANFASHYLAIFASGQRG